MESEFGYFIWIELIELAGWDQQTWDTVDPIVEIEFRGKKEFTSAKDDIGPNASVAWNEHAFFEPTGLSVADIENSKVLIKIKDQRVLKDVIVGVYEFDAAQVYFQEKHAIIHQWVALSNPMAKEFNAITGYLKVSISVLTSGDEQVPLTEDTGEDNTNDDSFILTPPHIQIAYYQIKIRIVKGEHLPDMDKWGSIDAYLKCDYMGKNIKTKAVTQKDNEVWWNQEIWLPAQMPIVSSRLIMKLFDKDKLNDEIVGSLKFDLKQYIEMAERGEDFPFYWHDIYGAHKGYGGTVTDQMNNNPEVASFWKGRILIQVSAAKTDNPQLGITNAINTEAQQLAQLQTVQQTYEIMAEVSQGILLPGKEKYRIKIKVGDFEIQTDKPKSYTKGYCYWNYKSKEKHWTTSYQTLEDMDFVYVYLMDDDYPISFWKGPASEFFNPNPKLRWVSLEPDVSVGKLDKPYKAGMVSFRLTLYKRKDSSDDVDFSMIPNWNTRSPDAPSQYTARCHIFQCKDLPSGDSDGTSDPYVHAWAPQDEKVVTKVINDNINPIFYQTLEIPFFAVKLDNDQAPPFVLNIRDQDAGITNAFNSDDFIGRAIIRLGDAAVSYDESIPIPKWHSIKMGLKNDDPEMGLILCSFQLKNPGEKFQVAANRIRLAPQMSDCRVSINVLGLRQLQSVGILPVKKPFVKFNLKTLAAPNKSGGLENLKTEPSSTGPNPTISTVIEFRIDLPNDTLYCPSLSCAVFDYMFKGLRQPQMGNFIIPIGEILQKQIEDYDNEERDLKQLRRELASIIQNAEEKKAENDAKRKQEEAEKAREEQELQRKKEQIEGMMRKALANQFKNRLDQQDDLESALNNQVQDAEEHTDDVQLEEIKLEAGEDSDEEEVKGGGDAKQSFQDKLKQSMIKKMKTSRKQQLTDLKQQEVKALEKKEEARRIIEEQLRKTMRYVGKNLVEPIYYFDDNLKIKREEYAPPKEIFMSLGYNPTPDADQKHYRKYYHKELESVPKVMPVSPFNSYSVIRGQNRGLKKSWFSKDKTDKSGQVSNLKNVGFFKGLITVTKTEDEEYRIQQRKSNKQVLLAQLDNLSQIRTGKKIEFDYDELKHAEGREEFKAVTDRLGCKQLHIGQHLLKMNYLDLISSKMMVQTKCIVRIYMIDGFGLVSRDNGSDSDPYLKMKLGRKKVNERDNHFDDEPCPKFNKYYDFEATFPGSPILNVALFDYDMIFGDDLIGETKIDLEDRFFSPEWQSLKNKPIETRSLYHPSSKAPQGAIRCWVEIHKQESRKLADRIWDITPEPPREFEVRLVVWETQDIPQMDIEETSDIYVKAFMNSQKYPKTTDTHYRCQNGNGSFNYRLLFDVEYPSKNQNINVQVYDVDIFSANDFIGDTSFSIQQLIKDCADTNKPIAFNQKYWKKFCHSHVGEEGAVKFEDENSFWLELLDKDQCSSGRVRVTLDILPKGMASDNSVGEGRSTPNHSPYLPPPTGRIQWSLNPFSMLAQFVGPTWRRRIYMLICIIICILILVFLGPMIFGQVVAQILNPLNW